jgi:hypothetical protein
MMDGFSYPCANIAKPDARLIDFLTADHQSVVNPFPLLAQRQRFYQDRTNPLIKLHYWASTDLHLGLEDFVNNVTFRHEKEHMSTHYSPAKNYARVVEARALQKVYVLALSQSWNTVTAKMWRELRREHNRLLTVTARICLSEELLAVARSFESFGRCIKAASDYADWESRKLSDLEEETIKYYERKELRRLFPDFRTLYYGTIKKVIAWAEDEIELNNNTVLGSLISSFLQGITNQKKHEGWAVDSYKQCLLLAEQVERMDNSAQLCDWLTEMVIHEGYYFAGVAAQKLLKEVHAHNPVVIESLNQMLEPEEHVEVDAEFPTARLLHIFISPNLRNGKWYIQPGEIHGTENTFWVEREYLKSKPVMEVFKLEALYEQLIAGDGICCPYFGMNTYSDDPCICSPGWKECLLRLLQWAREGKFGSDGIWRDLPRECCCGV